MKLEQIEIVKSSYAQIEPIIEQMITMFYGRLFDLDPGLQPLFKSSMAYQKSKIAATVTAIINSLDRPDHTIRVMKRLGSRLTGYGIRTEDYHTIGLALLWTLQICLGEAYTTEVAEAWTEAYYLIAGLMKEAAVEHEPV
jgi:hemoglobin-like flavoprotein